MNKQNLKIIWKYQGSVQAIDFFLRVRFIVSFNFVPYGLTSQGLCQCSMVLFYK